MCKDMFKTSGLYVYISQLIHTSYMESVAKKVTLGSHKHIRLTLNPQSAFHGVVAVKNTPVNVFFNTISTATTTTIFKLIVEKFIDQKNSSLTIHSITIYN